MKKSIALLALVMFSITALWAQNATVRGYVYNDADGEPAIFTNVSIGGTSYAAATDLNGFYSIPGIPPGTYDIIAFGIGYDSTVTKSVSLSADRILTKNIFLKEKAYELAGVDISAEREEKITEVQISKTTIDVEQIQKLPSVGGEADVAQYLQVIPGVIFTGDQGGQVYIRGGSPVQTRILLDGITIYNPFHSIGFFSVFETDIIKNIDVYTGAFSAEYGGRISAIMDIRTRDGNKRRHSGKIAVSPFQSKLILEGPLMKQKESGASITYLLTGKYSYLDRTSKTLYSYVDEGEIPYTFRDFYGKINFGSAAGTKFNLFGFNFRDIVNFDGTAKYDWNTLGMGTNFVIVPGGSSTIIGGNIAYSNYDLSLDQFDGQNRRSAIRGFNIGLDFKYFIRDGDIKYGVLINGFSTEFEFINSFNQIQDQNQNTTELSLFFNFRKTFKKKLVLEAGFRMEYYASLSNISPEPRVGLKYNVTDKLRLKAAAGLYSQNLISAKPDRDVVDLFTGFLSGPEQNLLRPDGSEAKHKLQKAYHGVVGVEVDVAKGLELSLEGYLKNFTQLISINRNKQFETDSDYQLETGRAYGMDFLVKYEKGGFNLWATYSLGYVRRTDATQTYAPHYDRRHNTNVVLSYGFGNNDSWEAGLRWNFGSGFPFTRTQGFYEDIDFVTNGIQTNYTTNNGQLGIVYEEDLNSGRLPNYHRLDLSMKKWWAISENSRVEVIASLTNVYNRENIFYFDRVEFDRVNQLPILPSLAVSLSF